MAPRLLIIDDDEARPFLSQLIPKAAGYDMHLTFSEFPQVLDIDAIPSDFIILDKHVGRDIRNSPLWQQLKASLPPSVSPTDASYRQREHTLIKQKKGGF